jgi:hypothetical protein
VETDATKSDDLTNVKYLIELYNNTNSSNPSWQKAHDLRLQYSPADFKASLLSQYPSAKTYINSNL